MNKTIEICPTCNRLLSRVCHHKNELIAERMFSHAQYIIETIDLFNWHCDSLHKMIENSIPENRRPVVWHIKISCELDGSAVKEEVKP